MSPRNVFVAVSLLLGLSLWLGMPSSARAADVYKVDPIHSAVVFRVKHFGVGYIHGRFNDLSGSVTFSETNPAENTLEMQVKAESIDSNNAKRDQHLKSPDFLSAKQFPTITFKSRQFRPIAEQVYEVSGDLTLHGVTRPLTVKLERIGTTKDARGGFRTGMETTFTISRSEFGIKFMPEGVGDEIRITVAVEAIR